MKKIITLLSIFFLFIIITGCVTKEEIKQTDTQINEAISKYPIIGDEQFRSKFAGLINIPEGYKLSNKQKFLLNESYSHIYDNPILREPNILAGGDNLSKEELDNLEINGRSYAESREDFYKSIGLNPELTDEQILSSGKDPQAILNDAKKELENRALPSTGLTYVTHYYEFSTTENPNKYYWCGHANLKGVAQKHGQLKTLKQIHTAFWNNSSAYRENKICPTPGYCASLLDLYYACTATNGTWNYKLPNTTTESISTITKFYQRMQDGIYYGKPAIVPSKYLYSVGHFYSVVGYKTVLNSSGGIDYSKSTIGLRNVALSSPGIYYENEVSVQTFYDKRSSNDVIFVRP